MNTLNHEEMAQIEGGFGPLVAGLIWLSGAVVGVTLGAIAQDWPDFKQGVKEGFTSTVASN
jgi:lactobin A/cerein 7B family class IIb bacteriocin